MTSLQLLVGGLALSLLGAGCGADAEAPVSSTSHPIINGTPGSDSTDPAVVMLYMFDSNNDTYSANCTAEVISSRVLLTAAHCVYPDEVMGKMDTWRVFLGADSGGWNRGDGNFHGFDISPYIDVAEIFYHPNYVPDPSQGNPNDSAILVLKTPLSVKPLPFNRAPLGQNIVGAAARIVGYGKTDANVPNSNARKFYATTTVAPFDSFTDKVVVGDATRHTCVGDSGGPALVMINGVQTIIGTTSFGPANCTGPADFQRTDLVTDFIDEALARYGDQGGGSGGGDDPVDGGGDEPVGGGGGDPGDNGGGDPGDSGWSEPAGEPATGGGTTCNNPCAGANLTEGQCDVDGFTGDSYRCTKGCLVQVASCPSGGSSSGDNGRSSGEALAEPSKVTGAYSLEGGCSVSGTSRAGNVPPLAMLLLVCLVAFRARRRRH